MQVNNLSYADADAIKRKVALTIQTKKDEIDKELEEREKRIQKAKRELKKRRK